MNRIKELRNERGYTQMFLADKIKIPQSTLSGWETGKSQIDYESLHTIADFFEVNMDYILGFSTNRSPNNNDSGSRTILTREEEEVISLWRKLSHSSKSTAMSMLQFLNSQQKAIPDVETGRQR